MGKERREIWKMYMHKRNARKLEHGEFYAMRVLTKREKIKKILPFLLVYKF